MGESIVEKLLIIYDEITGITYNRDQELLVDYDGSIPVPLFISQVAVEEGIHITAAYEVTAEHRVFHNEDDPPEIRSIYYNQ